MINKDFELMYVTPVMSDEDLDSVIDKYNGIVTTNACTIEKIDKWGRKHLAYEVAGNTEGLYVLITMNTNMNTIKELDKQLRLDERVLRHMIISKAA